jgi:hypothetical protein
MPSHDVMVAGTRGSCTPRTAAGGECDPAALSATEDPADVAIAAAARAFPSEYKKKCCANSTSVSLMFMTCQARDALSGLLSQDAIREPRLLLIVTYTLTAPERRRDDSGTARVHREAGACQFALR